MSDIQPDPLAEILAPPPGPAPAELGYQPSLAALRRRRQWRRAGGLGGLLAAYAAGLLSVMACIPPAAPAPRWAPAATKAREEVTGEIPPPDPVDLEWRAVEHPGQAAAAYRQAGDAYLGRSDPENAVRVYGAALDEAGGDGTDITANDSWLLMAIKQARKKESAQ